MIKGLVSVITPCYNGEKYIRETIDSVLKQNYKSWEMIIIDDGSTDNSRQIVKKYCELDKRIHLIEQKNSGSAAARNHGIREALGQYIALLDSDDVWYPNFLSEQIKFIKKKNSICVYSSYDKIGENSEIIHKPTIAKKQISINDMRKTNYVGCLTGLYDCSKYGKVYLHEELNSIRDDYAFWYDIVCLDGKAYGNLKILAKYRVLKSSTTGNKMKLIKYQYLFYKNYLGENFFASLFYTLKWGVSGIRKFYF